MVVKLSEVETFWDLLSATRIDELPSTLEYFGFELQEGRKGDLLFYRGNKLIARSCNKCRTVKLCEWFCKMKSGINSICKECKSKQERLRYEDCPEKKLESVRYYYQKNINLYREYARLRKKKFPEKVRLAEQLRRARLNALPYDETIAQRKEVWLKFGNTCALSGDDLEVNADHVIPIAIGHGGTTYGNMIPLSTKLNASKNAQHIFEWFEANRERFGLEQRKFDELIVYLAQVNEMTTQEYRAYVDWCFDNPRDISELKDAV